MGYDRSVWDSVSASARQLIQEHFGTSPKQVPYFTTWDKPDFVETDIPHIESEGVFTTGETNGEKAVRWEHSNQAGHSFFLPPLP